VVGAVSQRDRILKWLEERGRYGVHSFEMVEAGMPRGAAVVCALKKSGYLITATTEKFRGQSKGVRYTLVGSKSGGGGASSDAAVASGESSASGSRSPRGSGEVLASQPPTVADAEPAPLPGLEESSFERLRDVA
jgi:Helix-turn-helix domain